MFNLTVVTPERKILEDVEIEEVIVPAFRGELNILPGHAPLMSTLSTGVLKYKLKGQSNISDVAISWGYCEVSPNGVRILAETAETKEEIDLKRAESSLKKAQQNLESGTLDADSVLKFQRKVTRANSRLSLKN